jgi:hypothetical protein
MYKKTKKQVLKALVFCWESSRIVSISILKIEIVRITKKSAEQGRAKLIMDNHILTQKVDTFWLCCFE